LNSAINTYLGATGGVDLKRFKAHPGKGVEGKIEGALWFLGSTRWYEELTGQKAPITEGTCSLLFNETTWVAKISFEDQIHPNAKEVIGLLKSRNITPILASGDAQTAVEEVANALGIETYFGELQPSDKLEVLRKYAAQGRTMMVGDGINDTIALSTADVGVSLAHGTAAAQESAEVVLSREGLPQMKTYFALSTLTMKTIKGNLRWAFGYNIVAIPIAAGVLASPYGIELTPMMASIAMSFSSLGVVANSLRMHNKSL
jgi:P-type E1-E2 ATPase